MIGFQSADLLGLLPALLLVLAGMAVLLLEVFQRASFPRTHLAYVTALAALAAAGVSYLIAPAEPQTLWGGMVRFDALGCVITAFTAVACAITALGSTRYLEELEIDRGEYYALLLFATAGMSVMVSANDFVVLFLGLEMGAVAMYALTAYQRRSNLSSEAGFKYFLLGALGSALLVYGVAFLTGLTGSTGYDQIGAALRAPDAARHFANPTGVVPFLPLPLVGMALVFVAFLIKMAAAPFHMWAPDAYSGAPTPTTGFLSGAGKIAGVAALFRLFAGPFATPELSGGLAGWTTLAFFAAVASIVVGNLVALTQKRVRRMLAWSSVAHAGYLLLALCALGVKEAAAGSIRAVILYGAAYAIANAGAFIVLAAFGRDKAEADTLDELSGLGRKHPAMGLALSLFLISAAGLPPAAGFVAKLSLFSTAFAAGEGAATPAYCAEMLQWLAVGGLVLSVAGGLAYLRVIAHLYGRDAHVRVDYRPHTATTLGVAIAALLTLWMGLMPGRVLVWGGNVAKQLLPAPAVAAPSEPAAPSEVAPSEAPKAIEVVPLPNAELPR